MSSISGLLVVDKPGGMTSHDVVVRARGLLHTRRIGHVGTLDPHPGLCDATGVRDSRPDAHDLSRLGEGRIRPRFGDPGTFEVGGNLPFC